MKTSTLLSAAVVATLGFATVAQAQVYYYPSAEQIRAERQAQRRAERQQERQLEAERRLAEARAQAGVLGNYGYSVAGSPCPGGGQPYWAQETGMMSCPATGAPIGAPPNYWRNNQNNGYYYGGDAGSIILNGVLGQLLGGP